MIPRAGQAVPSKDGWSLLNFGKVFLDLSLLIGPPQLRMPRGKEAYGRDVTAMSSVDPAPLIFGVFLCPCCNPAPQLWGPLSSLNKLLALLLLHLPHLCHQTFLFFSFVSLGYNTFSLEIISK